MVKKTDKPRLGSEFFANNRKKLRQLFGGTAPIVITANGQMQRSSDQAFPFRQDSNFWYLTGVDDPDLVLVIDGDKDFIIVPKKTEKQSIFDGDINAERILVNSGVSELAIGDDGWKKLEKKLKRVKHVATLDPHPRFIEALNFYTNPARLDLIARLESFNPDIKFLDLKTHLNKLRQIKTNEEIEIISYAASATEDLFRLIKKKLPTYKNERQILAEILAYAAKNGFGLAYDPIVASGTNALTLHYTENNKKLKGKEPILLDVGLSYQGYNADITRVFCANPTKRQKQIHQQVLAIQDYAISLLKPNKSILEYEKDVAYFAGEKLRELGLVSIISAEEIAKFYPHSTSHFLGVDVHDAGDYSKSFEPGMVITVEPGIYIKEEGLGIRIEDDVLITEKGCQIISSKLRRDIS